MKRLLVIFLFTATTAFGQKNDVVKSMQKLHRLMVEKPSAAVVDLYLHDSLSYGHSNGWIENRGDFKKDLETKYIVYHSFKEDSVQAVTEGKTAYVRFIADIDVTLNGVKGHYHLKVLEVWVRKNKAWMLLARQAVKV